MEAGFNRGGNESTQSGRQTTVAAKAVIPVQGQQWEEGARRTSNTTRPAHERYRGGGVVGDVRSVKIVKHDDRITGNI